MRGVQPQGQQRESVVGNTDDHVPRRHGDKTPLPQILYYCCVIMPRLRRGAFCCATQLDTCDVIPGFPTSVESIFTMHPCVFPSTDCWLYMEPSWTSLIIVHSLFQASRPISIRLGRAPPRTSAKNGGTSHWLRRLSGPSSAKTMTSPLRSASCTAPSSCRSTSHARSTWTTAGAASQPSSPLSRRTMRVRSLHAHVFGACS